MADIYSNIYPDPAAGPARYVDATYYRGRRRTAFATIAATAALAANDKAFVAKIPSHAHLKPGNNIIHEALAGATSVSFGDANSANGLVDAQSMATAGEISVLQNVSRANLGKRLWELLGYSEDPRREIDLFLTFTTDVTGSGTIHVDLEYAID